MLYLERETLQHKSEFSLHFSLPLTYNNPKATPTQIWTFFSTPSPLSRRRILSRQLEVQCYQHRLFILLNCCYSAKREIKGQDFTAGCNVTGEDLFSSQGAWLQQLWYLRMWCSSHTQILPNSNSKTCLLFL
jgi:hypothetical protein